MPSSDPKILRVGLLNGIEMQDPRTAQDVESMFVIKQIFEAPYGTKFGTTEVAPILLDGPLREESPLRLVGRVREDILFSDGSPLTPEDVLDSLQRSAVVTERAKVERVGDELVFHLFRPNSMFALQLAHGQCGVQKAGTEEPLGTGPFVYDPASTPKHIRLRRNPYHRPLPKLDEVHFVTYPVDASGRPTALMEALQQGEVDLTNSLGRDDIHQVSGVRKSILPGVSTCFLFLNTASPALADRRLRRAIAHSIDRLEIARLCYSNALAFAASSLLPRPLGPGDDRLIHDPDKARALISEAGLQVPEKLRLVMVWGPRPYLPNPEAVAQCLAKQLGKLGIGLELVRTASSADFFEHSLNGDADLTLAGWVADTMDPADFLESILASSRIPNRENLAVSANEGRLDNKNVDRLLHDWRDNRSSQTLEEILDLVAEEAPVAPLVYGASATVHSFAVQQFKPSPMAHYPLTELDIWSRDS